MTLIVGMSVTRFDIRCGPTQLLDSLPRAAQFSFSLVWPDQYILCFSVVFASNSFFN